MTLVNSAMNGLFEAILWPMRSLPPLLTIAILALLSSVGMLIVFKKTSNQDRIARTKDRIFGCVFEIRLFNDDLRAIFRAVGGMLKYNFAYAGLSLVPAVWLIVPFVLVIAQLQSVYGWDGLRPEVPVLLKAQLVDDWEQRAGVADVEKPDVSLDVPDGITVQTDPVWIPESRELAWRVVGDSPGVHDLTLRLGDSSVSKAVYVDTDEGRRAPKRERPNFLHQLLYPAESPYPGNGVFQAVSIEYPDRAIDVFGFGVHWLIVYFVLSLAFAFALRNRFGVTI